MELFSLNPASIMIIIGLGAYAMLSWRRTVDALALIALLLPTYLLRFTVLGIPATFLEGMIIVLFVTWLIRGNRWKRINVAFWKKQGDNRMPREFRFPLTLFIIAAGIAAVLSPAQPDAFGILKAYFIEPLLYLIVMVYEVRTREALDRIIAALGILTIVIGIFAIYQYWTGIGIPNPFWADPAHRRITTFFGYPNANSLLVAPIVAYYLGSFSRRLPLRQQLFAILVAALGVLTVLAAQTTGAALALLITSWLLAYRMRSLRIPLIAITILGLLAFLLFTPLASRIPALYGTISRDHLDLNSSSLEIRINQWRETMSLLMDRPLIGGGLANYQAALTPYHRYDFLEIYLYPHNIVLNAWTELGVLGLIAMIWVLIRVYRMLRTLLTANMLSNDSRMRLWGIAAAWMVIIIHGLVDVPYFKNDLSVLWMVFLGALIVLHQQLSALTERHTKSW